VHDEIVVVAELHPMKIPEVEIGVNRPFHTEGFGGRKHGVIKRLNHLIETYPRSFTFVKYLSVTGNAFFRVSHWCSANQNAGPLLATYAIGNTRRMTAIPTANLTVNFMVRF
jgi:hypothetical protein